MVHFKTAASLFVVAAAVAPILATPIDVTSDLETREPKGFRSLGRIARKVGRFGASAVGALAGRDLEELELEAREPKNKHRHHHKKGGKRHRKHKKPAAAAADAAAPSDASTPEAREFNEIELEEREWEDVEVREPKRGHKRHHKKGGKRHHKHKKPAAEAAPSDASTPEARELNDIELEEREWEDIEVREPKQGYKRHHHKKGGKRHHKHKKPAVNAEAATAEASAPVAREFDDFELEVREPKQGHKRHHHKKGGKRHHKHKKPAADAPAPAEASTPEAREFDDLELEVREPKGHKHRHHKKGSKRHHKHKKVAAEPAAPAPADASTPSAREFEDIEDIIARIFDEEYDLD